MELLKLIDNPFSRLIVEAERQYLRTLEGGCTLPISVNAQVYRKDDETKQEIHDFTGLNVQDCNFILSGNVFDRKELTSFLSHTVEGSLSDAVELGKQLASELRENGAKDYVIKAEEFKTSEE